MYQCLEKELEEMFTTKHYKNKLAPLLEQIIQTENELRSTGIDKDLLSKYTSLQSSYYRKLLGYAYIIGYRHAKMKARR